MYIYILNFLLIPVIHLFCGKRKKMFYIIVTLQLFLLLALRDEGLGVDIANYRSYFYAWKDVPGKELLKNLRYLTDANTVNGVESGYVLFNWLIAKIGFSFNGYLVIHAAICTAAFSIFFYKYSKAPVISFSILLAFGIYSYAFCILRQALSVAIILFSIPYLKERKLIKFLLICLLAGWFHRIALLFLIVYPLSCIKLKNYNIIYVNVIIWLFLILTMPIIYRIIIGPFFDFIGKDYTLSFQMNNMIILLLGLFGGLLYLLRKSKQSSKYFQELKNKGWLWMYIVGIYLEIGSLYIPILSRAAIGLFLISLCILMPDVIESAIIKSERRIAYFGIYALCLGLYVYQLANDSLGIVPYVLNGGLI